MFQKGQLVKHTRYGDYYVINFVTPGGCDVSPLNRDNWFCDSVYFVKDVLRTVGNNYRQKARK